MIGEVMAAGVVACYAVLIVGLCLRDWRFWRGAAPRLGVGLLAVLASCCPVRAEQGISGNDLVAAHNVVRARSGFPPLSPDARLNAAAQWHAADMAARRTMAHQGADGSDHNVRVRRAGYPWPASENIAWGSSSVPSVMALWCGSPGHYANILGRFNAIGTGVAPGPDGRLYWCVVFGASR